MKLANIKAFARVAKQTIVKYSPEILMCMGGATFVATVVVACKETVKEQELLEDHETALDYVDLMNEEGEIDDKAYKVSRRNVYIATIKKTTINYAPRHDIRSHFSRMFLRSIRNYEEKICDIGYGVYCS